MIRAFSTFAALFWLSLSFALLFARSARASEGDSVVIWPTLTPAGDSPGPEPLHKPSTTTETALSEVAQEVDATLRDGAQDLGFRVYVADPGPSAGHMRDADIIERAAQAGAGGASNNGTWVVSPRIESRGGAMFTVRTVAVAPNGHELRVRVETVDARNAPVRALVMLRDLLSPGNAQAAASEYERERLNEAVGSGVMSPLRSQGRAVLSINAALFGGFLAYSVQRSSGSDDPRVLYPLLALGTGVGIGSALLVADEWDVTTGDAWLLSGGGWWGAAAGLLIADGRHVQPLTDRYAWGIGGGFVGLGLSTVALARYRMDEGDAMLAHSGGALGLFLGGLGELAYRGTYTDVTPYTGMGYGAAIGLVTAGALATQVTVSPSRVLLVDVGVGGGALLGAAAASPLIFNDLTEGKTRTWLAATMAGGIAGGAVTWFLTRNVPAGQAVQSGALKFGEPMAGVVGESATRAGPVPAYGVGWRGSF